MKSFLLFILFFSNYFGQPFESGVNRLSNYIVSNEFEELSENISDIELIDSIYVKSLEIFDYNYSDALIGTAFSTLAFQTMPIEVPFLNIDMDIPLSRSDKNLFTKKISNLPSDLFFDSPQNKFGDKDKLSHFFASAFFSNSVSIFNISEFIGIFVEIFEAALKVDGSLDRKDMMVNNLGDLFGISLKSNKNLFPSTALAIYNLYYFRITN